jgi:hypothetical protein
LRCAVIRQREDRSKGAVDNLPAEFEELIPIARQLVPGELPLILAHERRYHCRKFVHLTFRNNRNLLSLIIARKHDGESFGTANLPSTLSASGIPMYTTGVKQFQVAAFAIGILWMRQCKPSHRPFHLESWTAQHREPSAVI